MKEYRKNSHEEKEHEEEKYQFIREQILPQKKQQAYRCFQRSIIMFAAAILFGVISGGVFWGMQNFLPDHTQTDPLIVGTAAPAEVPAETDGKTLEGDGNSDGTNDFLSVEEYSRISRKMASVGEEADSSIVGIASVKNAGKWQTSSENWHSGLIFKETEKRYFILTDYAALKGVSELQVQFSDGTSVGTSIVGKDSNIGLGVLELDKKKLSEKTKDKIVTATFGSGVQLQSGTPILAVGKPNGVLYSVRMGRITNNNLTAPITDNELKLYTADIPYSIKGSGAVLNIKGKVLGFITTSYSEITGTSDMAFISISSVRDLIDRMMQGRSVAYLGIEGCDVSQERAENDGLEEGVYITSLYSQSPAYDGGMRMADIITEINDEKITSLSDLHSSLMKHKAGDKLLITVSRRDDKKITHKKLSIILK